MSERLVILARRHHLPIGRTWLYHRRKLRLTSCSPLSSCPSQAEQELRDELEVKLVASSLVCTVADMASVQGLRHHATEERRQETVRLATSTVNDGENMRLEMNKTNALVAILQADVEAVKGQQEKAIGEMEACLLMRIQELTMMTEVGIPR